MTGQMSISDATRGNIIKVKRKRDPWPWLMVLPATIYLVALSIYPLIQVVKLSLQRLSMTSGQAAVYIGVKNFINVLSTDRFWDAMKITGWFSIGSVAIQMLLGFIIALALDRLVRARQILTTLLLIPMMVAPAVVGFMWKMIYHPEAGPLNILLKAIGIPPQSWVADAKLALPSLLIADIWQWTPFVMILLLAGLKSLPKQVYDAAYVDGSTGWQTFKNITLPMMKPFIFLALILRFIDSFKAFDLIYIITQGGPGNITENLGFYTWRVGFRHFDMGFAAAMSVIQLVIIIITAQFAFAALKPRVKRVEITVAETE